MKSSLICAIIASFVLFFALPAGASPASATIRRVTVLGGTNNVEVEISATQAVTPDTQIITGPDRLIIDFPDSVLGPELRNFAVNHGDLKGIRVGQLSSNPPVTRVVFDLAAPNQYEVFPSGKTVIVKLQAPGARLVTASQLASTGIGYVTGAKVTSSSLGFVTGAKVTPMAAVVPAAAAESQIANTTGHLKVRFQGGKLSISADKATLAEVLFEVHKKTGADIPIPSGAEQEQVFTELGPAPPREVVTSLLQGSPFDFVLVGSEKDPNQLRSVQLTRRGNSAQEQPIAQPDQPAPPQQAQEPPQEIVQPEVQPEPPIQPEGPPMQQQEAMPDQPPQPQQ